MSAMENKVMICEACKEAPAEADTLSCFHVVCHKHVVNTPGFDYTCPACQTVVDKTKISTNAINTSYNIQQAASLRTLCENCEKDRRDVAAVWCFECYGFFCASDDEKIHSIGIFRHHQRDSDVNFFSTYAAQKAQGASIDEMLTAAGRGKSLRALENRVKSRYGNVGGNIGLSNNLLRGPPGAPRAQYGSAAYEAGSGVATPMSGRTQGLSVLSSGTSAGVCLIHQHPFTRFCQTHMRVVCEQCVKDLEQHPNATIGKTCEVQELFKTSKSECTNKCRHWLTREMLFSAISKLRKQIDAEIKALNELLGNEDNRSVFFTVRDRIETLKANLSQSILQQIAYLQAALDARMALLGGAVQEAHHRQQNLLQEQLTRLAYAEHFNSNVVRMGRYLGDKETIECLDISELEHVQTALEHYKQIRVNELPYAIGGTSLQLDPQGAANQLRQMLRVTDEQEDDLFAVGRVVESAVNDADALFEYHRLQSSSSDVPQARDVGAGDFGYFFSVRVLKQGGQNPSLRMGFIGKGAQPSEDIPMGGAGSTSFAFECTANGELQFHFSAGAVTKTVEVSLAASSIENGSKDLPPASTAWSVGSLIGCFFDRRKNSVQVLVDGKLSEEVSLRKLFKDHGFKFDVEAANPCVCLAQQGDIVRVEVARFVPDIGAANMLLHLRQ